MERFKYEAVNFRGEWKRAEIESLSRESLLEYLHQQNLVPTRISKVGDNFFTQYCKSIFLNAQKISESDFSILIQEVALMLKSGLTLEQALEVADSLASRQNIKRFLKGILSHIRKGTSFADSLAAQEDFRPNKAFIGMVRAGEMGGAGMMEKTLEHLSESLSRALAAREAVRSALVYPAILMLMAMLSVVVLLIFVLPQFEPLFQNAGTAPSFSAQLLMSLGHGLRDYWGEGSIVLLSFVLVFRRIMKSDRMKLWIDKKILRLPLVGILISKNEMAKFCHILGELQSNGIPLVKALLLATESLRSAVYIHAMTSIVKQVREGRTLSSLLLEAPTFPTVVGQMMRIGEETGRLDLMALKVSDIFEREVQRSTQRLIKLLAPMLTIIVGGVIASIIAIVVSAILSANDLIN